jgi:hypothetical protein
VVTTEGDEVVVALGLVTLQTARNEVIGILYQDIIVVPLANCYGHDKISHGIETDFEPVTKKIVKCIPREETMRSELIFMTVTRESNRFLLARLAAQATRLLQWSDTRIQASI